MENTPFTPKDKSIWESTPGDIRFKILNNVWCVQCRGVTGIANLACTLLPITHDLVIFTCRQRRDLSAFWRILPRRYETQQILKAIILISKTCF
jgi:hypothetical protein